ncbi:hypothetical protein V7S43_018641 [Phytophthora oleae]|uniref:CWF21 domain-containing protein n=1 Tax=Phytophthora oleae TaxID=2107226 RepID=A0ABD3ETZ9_9STRA
MYNGIGLRTVRGSGTNGYVQRNLSYVNASRTRQTLARNQRGGSSGDFDARGSGRNRPPPNPDILLHEQKRKVELQLLEMSLEMEDRGCDPEEIQEKVNRERERMLARLNDAGTRGQGNEKDLESSHARQQRKQEENKRMKDAFGIATDYVAGESFDLEMQEQRRQQRKEKREQEWKEREEARQQRMQERDEREEKMRARRDRFLSSHSRSRSRSPAGRRSRDRRGRNLDADKSRRNDKPHSRSPATERRSRRSSSAAQRKRRSVSSSRSRSSRSRSRSRSRKARQEQRTEKGSATKKKKPQRPRSSSCSSSNLGSSSASGSNRSRSPSHRGWSRGKETKIAKGEVKEEQLSVSVSPARPAVLKGEHKVLNLLGRSSVNAVTNDDSPLKSIKKEELQRSDPPADKLENTKEAIPAAEKKAKRKSPQKKKLESLPAALPVQVKKEEASVPRHSRSPAVDSKADSHKRKLRSVSPEDRRRRGRRSSSVSSRASRSPRRRRVRSRSQSRSRSSGRSRSRSRSDSRSRRRSSSRRRRRSPSRSRDRRHR